MNQIHNVLNTVEFFPHSLFDNDKKLDKFCLPKFLESWKCNKLNEYKLGGESLKVLTRRWSSSSRGTRRSKEDFHQSRLISKVGCGGACDGGYFVATDTEMCSCSKNVQVDFGS